MSATCPVPSFVSSFFPDVYFSRVGLKIPVDSLSLPLFLCLRLSLSFMLCILVEYASTRHMLNGGATACRYVPDAHLALLLGGLGMRLAGVTYLDYAERGNNSYEEVLQRNRGCLSPQLNETDRENFRDIVAATAAIHVVWDVFKHELSAKGSSPR